MRFIKSYSELKIQNMQEAPKNNAVDLSVHIHIKFTTWRLEILTLDSSISFWSYSCSFF